MYTLSCLAVILSRVSVLPGQVSGGVLFSPTHGGAYLASLGRKHRHHQQQHASQVEKCKWQEVGKSVIPFRVSEKFENCKFVPYIFYRTDNRTTRIGRTFIAATFWENGAWRAKQKKKHVTNKEKSRISVPTAREAREPHHWERVIGSRSATAKRRGRKQQLFASAASQRVALSPPCASRWHQIVSSLAPPPSKSTCYFWPFAKGFCVARSRPTLRFPLAGVVLLLELELLLLLLLLLVSVKNTFPF